MRELRSQVGGIVKAEGRRSGARLSRHPMPLLIEKIENANPKLIKFTFWFGLFFVDGGKKFV